MTQIYGLISRQVRKWELNQTVSRRFAQDEAARAAPRTVVTVSREKSSGGSEAAKLVAKELGFDLYDREIIDAVAKEARTDTDTTKAHDEGAPDAMREIIVGFLEGRGGLTASAYLHHLVRVFRAIETKGNAVIIGRGASCVLSNSFRVRVVAPFDLRVERIHVIDGVTLEQARRTVLESDKQRKGFVKGHFGCDPDDPLTYDLIINTAGKSIEHTAELIVLGVRQFQQAAQAAQDAQVAQFVEAAA